MTLKPDMRAALDDPTGLLEEIERRDKIIAALAFQVECNLNDQGRDYGLLQTTFVLEEQVRQRTAELVAALDSLRQVSSEATAARDQLAAAVESSSDGFALFDPQGRVLLCNGAFRKLWAIAGAGTGQSLETLLAEAHFGPAEARSALLAELEACRAGHGPAALQLPGGRSVSVRERRMADGCVVGVYTDVTALQAEEARLHRKALADKSRLLQTTLDTIDQGIAVFDVKSTLVAWNQRFFSLLGLTSGKARVGATPGELAGFEDHLIAKLCAGAGQAGPLQQEHALASGLVLDIRRFAKCDGGFVLTASDITGRVEGEKCIRSLLAQQRAIFDNAHVGILYVRNRSIVEANVRMAEIFGYDSPAEMIGQSTEILFPSLTDFLEIGDKVYAELTTRGYSEGEFPMRRRDGRPLWIRLSGRPVDPQAPREGSIWVYSDVSDQHEQQAQLELAQLVFNHSNEALMVTDANNIICSVNSAFTTITGYSEAEVLGQSPRMFKSGEHDEHFYREMWTSLLAHDRWEGEIIDRHKSGRLYPKWLSVRVVRGADSRIAQFVAAFSDITLRKAAEEKIHHMAHHDPLTGLPNRVLLRDRFDQMYQRVRREGRGLAMYFLDLDHFKRVNDTLGHRAGDELLTAVTQRLQGCLRACDTVSRLGGDEFIILVECAESPRFAAVVAEKIGQALNLPMELEGQVVSVSGTLGIAMAPGDGSDFDTLLKKSDMAMYHTKAAGRGSYGFFDERMNKDTAQRLVLTTGLRHALERHELSLVYQPQFNLAHPQIVGVEALMRWNSERFGEVSPSLFIQLAEETGLIPSIGEWALFESCRQARLWADAGFGHKVGVNVSAMQVFRDDFTASLAAVLRDTGASPTQLELELTESTLMADTPRIIEVIDYLRALGIAVAIDDFGTGYSSLAYLKRFQVSKLKVDRSFVRDIPDDEDDCAITQAIVMMAQSLRLRVVAEGVETREQLEFLNAIGCHEAQGYLFSRPVPPQAIADLLAPRRPMQEVRDAGAGVGKASAADRARRGT